MAHQTLPNILLSNASLVMKSCIAQFVDDDAFNPCALSNCSTGPSPQLAHGKSTVSSFQANTGCPRPGLFCRFRSISEQTAHPRVVGNLRRPPKTCHSSSESWENGDSKYVIRYAGKIRPFLKFQYLYNIPNYFFWPDLRRLPSQQAPNISYVLVANMLESNPVVRNISELHLRLHKLRCIPILTLHFQHGPHSPPPAASF